MCGCACLFLGLPIVPFKVNKSVWLYFQISQNSKKFKGKISLVFVRKSLNSLHPTVHISEPKLCVKISIFLLYHFY